MMTSRLSCRLHLQKSNALSSNNTKIVRRSGLLRPQQNGRHQLRLFESSSKLSVALLSAHFVVIFRRIFPKKCIQSAIRFLIAG